jgi:hypothetical protein
MRALRERAGWRRTPPKRGGAHENRSDHRRRFRPGGGADGGLVPLVDDQAGRRRAKSLAQGGRVFIHGPTGAECGDFEDCAIGITEIDGLEVMPIVWPGHGDAGIGQAPFPLQEAWLIRDLQRHVMRAANAGRAARRAAPFEKGNRRAWPAQLIAKVEVIAAGVIEVDRQLDQALAEQAAVKVNRALRIRAHDRDVMQTENGHLDLRVRQAYRR